MDHIPIIDPGGLNDSEGRRGPNQLAQALNAHAPGGVLQGRPGSRMLWPYSSQLPNISTPVTAVAAPSGFTGQHAIEWGSFYLYAGRDTALSPDAAITAVTQEDFDGAAATACTMTFRSGNSEDLTRIHALGSYDGGIVAVGTISSSAVGVMVSTQTGTAAPPTFDLDTTASKGWTFTGVSGETPRWISQVKDRLIVITAKGIWHVNAAAESGTGAVQLRDFVTEDPSAVFYGAVVDLANGRLYVMFQTAFSKIIYSDDGGTTWTTLTSSSVTPVVPSDDSPNQLTLWGDWLVWASATNALQRTPKDRDSIATWTFTTFAPAAVESLGIWHGNLAAVFNETTVIRTVIFREWESEVVGVVTSATHTGEVHQGAGFCYDGILTITDDNFNLHAPLVPAGAHYDRRTGDILVAFISQQRSAGAAGGAILMRGSIQPNEGGYTSLNTVTLGYPSDLWTFADWADIVLYCNGTAPIRKLTSGGDEAINVVQPERLIVLEEDEEQSLSLSYIPTAKHIAVWGSSIVAVNLQFDASERIIPAEFRQFSFRVSRPDAINDVVPYEAYQSWATTGFGTILEGEPLTAGFRLGEDFFVCSATNVHRLELSADGHSVADFPMVEEQYGVIAPRSIAEYDGKKYFLSRGHVCEFNGRDARPITPDLRTLFGDLCIGFLDRAFAVIDPDLAQYRVWLPLGDGDHAMNAVLVIELDNEFRAWVWRPTENERGLKAEAALMTPDGQTILISQDGLPVDMGDYYNDDGQPIDFDVLTHQFEGENGHLHYFSRLHSTVSENGGAIEADEVLLADKLRVELRVEMRDVKEREYRVDLTPDVNAGPEWRTKRLGIGKRAHAMQLRLRCRANQRRPTIRALMLSARAVGAGVEQS